MPVYSITHYTPLACVVHPTLLGYPLRSPILWVDDGDQAGQPPLLETIVHNDTDGLGSQSTSPIGFSQQIRHLPDRYPINLFGQEPTPSNKAVVRLVNRGPCPQGVLLVEAKNPFNIRTCRL